MPDNCPWCGMPVGHVWNDEIIGYTCSTLSNDPEPRSIMCLRRYAEKLKDRNEKLEDFVRLVRQADEQTNSLDGFDREVRKAITALHKSEVLKDAP